MKIKSIYPRILCFFRSDDIESTSFIRHIKMHSLRSICLLLSTAFQLSHVLALNPGPDFVRLDKDDAVRFKHNTFPCRKLN